MVDPTVGGQSRLGILLATVHEHLETHSGPRHLGSCICREMLNPSRHAEGTFCFGLTNKEEMVHGGVQSRWMRKEMQTYLLGRLGSSHVNVLQVWWSVWAKKRMWQIGYKPRCKWRRRCWCPLSWPGAHASQRPRRSGCQYPWGETWLIDLRRKVRDGRDQE